MNFEVIYFESNYFNKRNLLNAKVKKAINILIRFILTWQASIITRSVKFLRLNNKR